MVYKFFDKEKLLIVVLKMLLIKKYAGELHRPIIRRFDKIKSHPPFIGNTWGADLSDVQLISKINKGFRVLLYIMICTVNMYCSFF